MWDVKYFLFILGPSSCVIQESDLTEGLRVLIKLEGHFYPGQIQAISPPDIYGVLVDRERGNKPHIFSREEVLQDAVSFISLLLSLSFSLFISLSLSLLSPFLSLFFSLSLSLYLPFSLSLFLSFIFL